MRYVIVLAIGLLVGALCAMTAASVLGQRHAYPKAVMRLLQRQLGDARSAAVDRACADNARRFVLLAAVSEEIGRAIPSAASTDRVFDQYLDDLRREVAGARGAADCTSQREALTRVANACDACHRDYR
ncbi:MAG: cytochrome c [Xanthomonadales bacterium]|nr:cytochrome c [Xanthomonadales bacterium]